MNLWVHREKALDALREELRKEASLLNRAFQQMEYLAQALHDAGKDDAFARVTALFAAKGRFLAQGTYSLMLDGLGQEAGATGRVWLEAIELLTYLRKDTSRISEVLEDRLPKAGKRAKRIEGFAKELRSFWSDTASHLGLEVDSWKHVLNWQTGQLKTRFVFSAPLLRKNMGLLFMLLMWNIAEAARCLGKARGLPEGYVSDSLAQQIDSLREEGFEVLGLSPPAVFGESEVK